MIRSIRNLIVCVLMALILLAGCKSTPKASSKGKDPVTLDHAGRALNQTEYPRWLLAWREERTVSTIERTLYRNDYCFVEESTGSNLKAVQAWMNTIQINNIMGARISTRVGSMAEANIDTQDNATYSNFMVDAQTVSRDATYTGFEKTSDYWIKQRIYDPDDETIFKDEYTVYVLYTIDKKILNEQIANKFREIQNNANTKEEREMWTGLIQAVLERGLGVEAVQQSPGNQVIYNSTTTVTR